MKQRARLSHPKINANYIIVRGNVIVVEFVGNWWCNFRSYCFRIFQFGILFFSRFQLLIYRIRHPDLLNQIECEFIELKNEKKWSNERKKNNSKNTIHEIVMPTNPRNIHKTMKMLFVCHFHFSIYSIALAREKSKLQKHIQTLSVCKFFNTF